MVAPLAKYWLCAEVIYISIYSREGLKHNWLQRTLSCPCASRNALHADQVHIHFKGTWNEVNLKLIFENTYFSKFWKMNKMYNEINNWRNMYHFSYSCKTERENGICRWISTLCINRKFTSECYSGIFPKYSQIIDYSIIWMCIWYGLIQKPKIWPLCFHLNSQVSFKL